ncbi:hypothetical protein SAMN05216551_107130 [Chitinasiproducens palmae]|uniref:Lipoprotein n=1 Tax=Chitinasiproducens palmae TaxID=1770053 RepID=A0A1H2PQR8_9BURK|nr:hypothetical protein SAMN05216551_107130 [Chitinasiproducens palmae]
MMRLVALSLCVALAACGTPRPRYAPRLPCPDLPELSANPTRAELEEHDLTVVRMYGKCRAARRVNPRVEAKP